MNNKLLQNFRTEIENNISKKNTLFNISTGKAAKPDTALFLFNMESYGKKLKDEFINECSNDALRFEKTRKLVKVKSFASEKIIKKIRISTGEKNTVIQRDIWG